MADITRTIEINAPVDKVFEYVSDYQNWSEFYEGLSDVKPVTESTSSSGSKFIYKTRSAGMTFAVGTEFHDFVKNEGWTGKSFKGVKHQTKWIFRDKNGKTEFTHGVIYHLPILYGGKLLDWLFMKSSYERTIEKSLENVKRVLESG